jgi:protein-tyrosine phosphatase
MAGTLYAMTAPERETDDIFEVIFLCTGNRARSVIAEAALRQATEGQSVTIRSAGVLDLRGKPALPEAERAAARYGLDLSQHASVCLTDADLGSADLVIGFQRDHVAAAVVDGGADPDTTFSFRELLRLLRQLGPQRASGDPRALLAQVNDVRQGVASFDPDDEIADPIGSQQAVFEGLAKEIFDSCTELAERLGLTHIRTGTP